MTLAERIQEHEMWAENRELRRMLRELHDVVKLNGGWMKPEHQDVVREVRYFLNIQEGYKNGTK